MNELIKIESCVLTLDKKLSRNCFYMEMADIAAKQNKSIILTSIKFINSSKRFDGQLM